MKFSTNEDIQAPIDHVFKAISDFDAFERSALRRGAELNRIEPAPGDSGNIRWDMVFQFKGKKRVVAAELTEIDASNGLRLAGETNSVQGDFLVELVPLSKTRTRLHVSIELSPTSLTGRLLLQSLKLARGSLKSRFKNSVELFAADVEKSNTRGRLS